MDAESRAESKDLSEEEQKFFDHALDNFDCPEIQRSIADREYKIYVNRVYLMGKRITQKDQAESEIQSLRREIGILLRVKRMKNCTN